MTDVSTEIRDFWDADAATYHHSVGHAAHPRGAGGVDRRTATAAASSTGAGYSTSGRAPDS